MAPFACPQCQRLNHFEATACPDCAVQLAYDPAIDAFRAWIAPGDQQAGAWVNHSHGPADLRLCANHGDYGLCNWLLDYHDPEPLCRACRHNAVIPDLTVAGVQERWAKVEAAKRRLIHTLIKLKLPVETPATAPEGAQGFAFHFLYDPAAEQGEQAQVMTGHADGIITLNLVEADDARRQSIREAMGEPYRTLLGHFRHEIGHHYWARLVEPDPARLEQFRAIFGDERADYGQALSNHYGSGDDEAWKEAYISAYAASHPWEDFAETFAHYLHMVDTLATGDGVGLSLHPEQSEDLTVEIDFNPYRARASDLVAAMAPLSFAMNCINRAMGQPDLYPFHLGPAVVEKLAFVQKLVAG